MKNRYINIVYKRLIGVTLTLAACSVVMVVANKMGYSMGYDPDEAAYLNSLYEAGYSPEEVHQFEIEYEKEHHTGWYADDEPAPTQSQPSAQSEKTHPATKQSNANETANPSPAPAKTYSHDFDSITDEAREAFRAFTSDGQPNSCYLNINGSSKDNIITGKELNATRTGKEDGKITFKDNGETRYEWIFSNWTSEDEFSLDLTVKFGKDESSPDRYVLAFSDGDIGNNNIHFRLRTGAPSTKIYVYDSQSNKSDAVTDNNGFLTINLKTLGKYIISTSGTLTKDDVADSLNTAETETISYDMDEIPFSDLEGLEGDPGENMISSDTGSPGDKKTGIANEQEDIFVDPGYSNSTQKNNDVSNAEEKMSADRSKETVEKTDSQAEAVPEAIADNVLVIDDSPSMPNPLFIIMGIGLIVLLAGGIIIYRYKR